MESKNKIKIIIWNIIEYFIMYGWLIIIILPFSWIFSLSLRRTETVLTSLFFQSLDEVTLENFFYLFKGQFPYRNVQVHFITGLKNSTIVTLSAVIGILVISILAAYAFSKLKFFGKSGTFYFILAGIMVPTQVLMLPLFKVVRFLGIQDSFLGLIFAYIATGLPLAIFIFTGFFFRKYSQDLIPLARSWLKSQSAFWVG